jgi:hypothetical protein
MTKLLHIGSTNTCSKQFPNCFVTIKHHVNGIVNLVKLITYLADETSNSRRNVKNDSNFYLSFISPKH